MTVVAAQTHPVWAVAVALALAEAVPVAVVHWTRMQLPVLTQPPGS